MKLEIPTANDSLEATLKILEDREDRARKALFKDVSEAISYRISMGDTVAKKGLSGLDFTYVKDDDEDVVDILDSDFFIGKYKDLVNMLLHGGYSLKAGYRKGDGWCLYISWEEASAITRGIERR